MDLQIAVLCSPQNDIPARCTFSLFNHNTNNNNRRRAYQSLETCLMNFKQTRTWIDHVVGIKIGRCSRRGSSSMIAVAVKEESN